MLYVGICYIHQIRTSNLNNRSLTHNPSHTVERPAYFNTKHFFAYDIYAHCSEVYTLL